MTKIKKSELVLLVRVVSSSDALGMDCYDIYQVPQAPHLRIVHKTGVAAGWELNEFRSFEFNQKNEKILNEILQEKDERVRYQLIQTFELKNVSVDENN